MPARRRPLLRDVAEAAGVSTGLASYALNDRPGVAPETRARILATAKALGYEVNPQARSLRTGRSSTVALALRSLQNPYFIDVIAGAQEAAFERGMSVLVVDSADSVERELRHVQRLAAFNADGLGICPVRSRESIDLWRTLRPDSPLVALNALTPNGDGLVRVSADRRRAVTLATGHLAALGHRRVAFLSPLTSVVPDHERRDIFLEVAPTFDVEPVVVETRMTAASTFEAVRRLLRRPGHPAALVANSDFAAHAVYEAARACGVTVGGELSVVGQDDLPTSKLLEPALTTIRLDRREIGRAVLERLVDPGLGDHRAAVELVVRASSAPVRG
jgi:DNA-binding LacI/PurR family transcriptional regulator